VFNSKRCFKREKKNARTSPGALNQAKLGLFGLRDFVDGGLTELRSVLLIRRSYTCLERRHINFGHYLDTVRLDFGHSFFLHIVHEFT